MSYTTVKIPTKFVEEYVDPLVNEKEGYSSRTEVLKEAIRMLHSIRKNQIKVDKVESTLATKTKKQRRLSKDVN